MAGHDPAILLHAAARGPTDYRFVARGAASPDLPLRLLNLFAQQGLAYDHAAIEREGECYVVTIALSGLDLQRARIIVEKMRATVLVETAELHLAPSIE